MLPDPGWVGAPPRGDRPCIIIGVGVTFRFRSDGFVTGGAVLWVGL